MHPSQSSHSTIPPSTPSGRVCKNDYEKPVFPGAALKMRVRCGRTMQRVIAAGGVWFRCDHCDPLT